MITISDLDPALLARLRGDEPKLWPNHLRLVRLAHVAHTDELRSIDAELEVLAARRRGVIDRLQRLRPRLWPESHRRHVRRRSRVDERALPPPVIDAEPLHGVELRSVIVAIVRRHGDISLRELHGLIHRYGYAIEGDRAVQRLGDAAAYETRQGRLRRVDRGVYGPAPGSPGFVEDRALLAWAPPEADLPPAVDPELACDPERWSDQRWPASSQCGGEILPPPVEPDQRSLGEDLTAAVAATRHRLAALIESRPPRSRTSRPTSTHRSAGMGNDSSTNRSPGSSSGAAGP